MASVEVLQPPSGRTWRRGVDRRLLSVLVAIVSIGVLVWPIIAGRAFVGWDWYQHQWYVWHMAEAWKAHGHPTLFAHDDTGLFNPHFAFYGGTLYAITGLLAAVLGDPGTAMVVVVFAGFAAAYGGFHSLARQFGLTGWVAHAPALLFVSSPYYLTLLYGVGGLGELMAVSVIPLGIASVVSLLRSSRTSLRPAAGLAVATVIATGSHNISLLWGGTVLAILLAALCALVPSIRRRLTRRGIATLAAIVFPALMVNAWYLLPDVVFQSKTVIANWTQWAEGDLRGTMRMVRPSHVLSLGRGVVDKSLSHFALQLPVLGLAWVLGGLAVSRTGWRSPWVRVVGILVGLGLVLTALMESADALWILPRPWNNIQFSYRLESYILLVFAGAVLGVALLLRARGGRAAAGWTRALAVVVAIWFAGAAWQVQQQSPITGPEWTSARPYFTRDYVPSSFDYASNLGIMAVTPDLPLARFDPREADRTGRAEATVLASPGTIVRTNVIVNEQLTHLEGGRFVGREDFGQGVVELSADATPGAAKLVVTTARPWPVVAGAILSVVGLLGLALGAAGLVRRR